MEASLLQLILILLPSGIVKSMYIFCFFFIVQTAILNCLLSSSIDIIIMKINDTFSHVEIFLIFKFIRLTKIKEFAVPTQVNSASLHPDCSMFVCGGEDFKMYKFDYDTGAELGEICHVFKFRNSF